MHWWLRTLSCVACSACFQPTPPAGGPCNEALECPAPLVCYSGTCQLTPPLSDAPMMTDMETSADAPPPVDAAPACATPANLPSFGAATRVTALSGTTDEGTPSVTADGLELYFKSNRAGGKGMGDIWKSSRASAIAAWGAPVNVAELNTTAAEGSTEISPDGLTLYFSSDRTGSAGALDLWVATRPDRTSAWSAPTRIAALSSPRIDEGIYVSADGRVAYFQSDRDTATVDLKTIYRSTRASTQSAWSTPVKVTELDSGTGDENPWLTADDCTIYFQSVRAGGAGLADLWMARRPNPTSPFAAPVVLSGVNGTGFDADPLLSSNERYIMFVSNRVGLGGFDIYEASR